MIREIETSELASEFVGSLIISNSCFFRSVESAQPQARAILGKPNFRNPFAPMSLSYSSENLAALLLLFLQTRTQAPPRLLLLLLLLLRSIP
jgi:hypothetical protein